MKTRRTSGAGAAKKHRCRPCPAVPSRLCTLAVSAPLPFAPLLCRHSPARIPVRGVISTPVLRLRPFAALVPLRDYPSGSVPCKEPCRAVAAEEGRKGQRGRHSQGTQAGGDSRAGAAPMFFSCTRSESKNSLQESPLAQMVFIFLSAAFRAWWNLYGRNLHKSINRSIYKDMLI